MIDWLCDCFVCIVIGVMGTPLERQEFMAELWAAREWEADLC